MKIAVQIQQFFILLTLLVLGKITAYLYVSWMDIVLLLSFSLLIEHASLYLRHKQLHYLSFSAFSTALGLMLMMYAIHLWIYAVVLFLALIQKHFLRYKERHFFNPSNFALIMALLFFYKDAHIVLGQLGEALWFEWLVVLLAASILVRAKRWFIPISFVVFYVGLQILIVIPADPTMILEDVTTRFYSISFVLFVSFMLTDPRTTPHYYLMQLFFSLSIALGASLLDYWFGFRVQHLFLVLFLFTFVFVSWEILREHTFSTQMAVILGSLFFLVLSVIIYIQVQTPYYIEMYG